MRTLLALALLAATTAGATPATAQEATLSASGKGIAGGILLGGEIGAFSGAVLRLEPDWAFAAAITVGAAVGGGAGFVVERDAESRASDVLLIAGMGLLVPVIVWVGDLRAPRAVDRVSMSVVPELGASQRAGLRLALSAAWP